MARQSRSNRRAYSRVSREPVAQNDHDEQQQQQDVSSDETSSSLEQPLAPDVEPPPLISDDSSELDDDDSIAADRITVVVLDPAHTRFKVSTNPEWTVLEFKKKAVAVHKVPASSQRLIFRGKMLPDDSTLSHFGITENDTIVHLFPKPNVVVTGESCEEEEISEGAHVPRIVLDPDEAERRSQILVLASDEIFEAQHRVKLLCLLLLIVSSIEIMNLITIMAGNPDTSDDDDEPPPTDPTHHHHDDNDEIRPWQNSDYADLIISAFGFYVAMLGIKATTENTLHLAKVYMYGTALVGVCWSAFKYYATIEESKAYEEENHQEVNDADIYGGALPVFFVNMMVWTLCCLRAWQFHELLREAEQEAEERTRSELELDEEQAPVVSGGDVQHDQELVLQIDENTRIT